MGVEFGVPFDRKVTVKLGETDKSKYKNRILALLKRKEQEETEKAAAMKVHKTRIQSTEQEISRLCKAVETGEEEKQQVVRWERIGGQKALIDTQDPFGEYLELHPLDPDEAQTKLEEFITANERPKPVTRDDDPPAPPRDDGEQPGGGS